MSVRFSTLASGSSGNSAVIWAPDMGVMIDFGLGTRLLNSRMRDLGLTWKHIHAVILTHTHADHWRREILEQILHHRIPIYCHIRHIEGMTSAIETVRQLRNAGLMRFFESEQRIDAIPNLIVAPLEVPHDAYPTFAFRLDYQRDDVSWKVGYASDLGNWNERLLHHFSDVSLLALEFNHDVVMERKSRRPTHLIQRVLSDYGHLSNEQAAAFVAQLVERGHSTPLQHIVQLHLSRQCNTPNLAQDAAYETVAALAPHIHIHTASQDAVLHPIRFTETYPPPPSRVRIPKPKQWKQPSLPGFDTNDD